MNKHDIDIVTLVGTKILESDKNYGTGLKARPPRSQRGKFFSKSAVWNWAYELFKTLTFILINEKFKARCLLLLSIKDFLSTI